MNNRALQEIKENIITALQPYFLEDEDYTNEIEAAFDSHLTKEKLKSVVELNDFDINKVADHVVFSSDELGIEKRDDLRDFFNNISDDVTIDTGRDIIHIQLEKGNLHDIQHCEEFAERMNHNNPNQLKLAI